MSQSLMKTTLVLNLIPGCPLTISALQMLEALLCTLPLPPSMTCVRVAAGHTHCQAAATLQEHLRQSAAFDNARDCATMDHPQLPDVLLVPVLGPRQEVRPAAQEVIVGAGCGYAVMRGAHVFAPGVISAPKDMRQGELMSVYLDILGKCRRGALQPFNGPKMFVGNGLVQRSRCELFAGNKRGSGIAVKMTEPLYASLCLDQLPDWLFPQNLPSVVVGHVLNPQPGERILDMCAAPGGKTTHLANLMQDRGEIIALDKISRKVERLLKLAEAQRLTCIKAYCCDSTRVLKEDGVCGDDETKDAVPSFSREYFDRALLDAPCSGLGQRPRMSWMGSLAELDSYSLLQRKLIKTAVKLLRPGGTLVYSTCTVTLAENEEQVAWALKHFPELQLVPQEPRLGDRGFPVAGLGEDHLDMLQRFDPGILLPLNLRSACPQYMSGMLDGQWLKLANTDTIGFFIAKFEKKL
uniref:tRNA (cytosine(72)-C(5))-methyltransferase NSUN6 isoform X2 n=1 Tax=Myxine glutinosa TaxID=7769 RepID=UPI00358FD1EA